MMMMMCGGKEGVTSCLSTSSTSFHWAMLSFHPCIKNVMLRSFALLEAKAPSMVGSTQQQKVNLNPPQAVVGGAFLKCALHDSCAPPQQISQKSRQSA